MPQIGLDFLVGVSTGFLVLFCERLPLWIGAIRDRRLHQSLAGTNWFGYHATVAEGAEVIIATKWKIKKGFLRPFVASYEHVDKTEGKPTGLSYKGEIILEGDDRIIFVGTARTHAEHIVYRFAHPLSVKGKVIPGIWLGFDHDKHICAGAAILADRQLSSHEAMSAIEAVHVSTTMRSLHIDQLSVHALVRSEPPRPALGGQDRVSPEENPQRAG